MEEMDNLKFDEIMEGQLNIFKTRKESITSQINIHQQRIKQFEEEIRGLEGLNKAKDEQLNLISDEIESNKVLRTESGGMLGADTIPGSNKSILSGLGVVFRFANRV